MKFENKDQRVRGRTGKVTQINHEFQGRYMWELEVFTVDRKKKEMNIHLKICSLDAKPAGHYLTEDQAKKEMIRGVEKTISMIQKLGGGKGNEGFEMVNGVFVPRGLQ